MTDNRYERPPLWMVIVMIVMLLPLFSWPAVIAALPEGESGDNWRMMVYVFPVYAILSVYCAYRCYMQRRELSVVLLALLLLSYLAVGFNVFI